MAKCAYCGSAILFGGKQDGAYRFCNAECHSKGQMVMVASQIPEDVVKQHALQIHSGACPKCNQQQGPVEVHTVHTVWSALVTTSWSSKPQISCRPCGVKAQLIGTASSLVVGWWGFPWGLIMTPVQVARNIGGLMRHSESATPSDQLEQLVRLNLAAHVMTQHATKQ
jgi:hypothetical protein